jgi:methionyl-tRNA synthetase
MKNFYITTPIYYPSGRFHIGTAYTTLLADLIARYKRLEGYNVKLLTGMDEHGQKIQIKALEAKLNPQEYVDKKAEEAQKLWKALNISDYDFIRTTNIKHKEIVIKIFNKFLENNDIYLGQYKGWYCIPCESFFSESQLVDEKCPDCGREVKLTEEENYFFNMKKYQGQLIKFYEENPEFLEPTYRKEEMMNNFIRPGLEDLCISRSTFDWGIKLPNDPKHVMYVWLDALCNYITSLGYLSDDDQQFKNFWPADIQIVGKDIVRFHAIYWPIFLIALGLKMPKKLYAHGFIMMKEGKMSKSKGTLIFPDVLAEEYGVDTVRYFLIKLLGYGSDSDFTPELFVERYNFDLCNDLGNLLNRTIAMINKYLDGNIGSYKGSITDHDKNLEEIVVASIKNFKEDINNLKFSNSLNSLWEIIKAGNKYIELTEPWLLAKDDSTKEELESVMYHLIENLRIFAIYIEPCMPTTSKKILEQLGISDKDVLTLESTDEYGKLKGTKVIEKGIPLFERLDFEKEVENIKNMME